MSELTALKVANINDQKFLPELEEKFRGMQEALARYVYKHDHRAIGAKATLTVKITLAVEESKEPSIKAEIDMKIPADPAHVGMARFGHDEHGPCCKVQKAGSFKDSPRQGRMFTDDGRKIDRETGEILEGPSDPGDARPNTPGPFGPGDQNPRPSDGPAPSGT
jgi:hypothetical protein